jgi:hypothetical protein
MTLAQYIKKRNGVPLGAENSMRNMLYRSLGANNFAEFWRYWNPIFSYYLGKLIFKPLKVVFPTSLALVLTFIFCGVLHDAVSMLVSWRLAVLFTPWFLLMSLGVVISNFFKFNYSVFPWILRAFINLVYIGICFFLAYQVRI